MDTAPQVPESLKDRARGFSLSLRGSHLELVVSASAKDTRAVNPDTILAAVADYPADISPNRVLLATRQHSGLPVTIGEIRLEDTLADWEIQVSTNRMVAYLIPRIAPNDAAIIPVEIGDEALRAAISAAGVTYGLLEDVIASFSPPAVADQPIVIARGDRPTPGVNGKIDFTFNNQQPQAPIMREDGSVDHRAATSRSVDAGTVLAVHHAPQDGTYGTNVLGRPIPVPPPVDHPLSNVAGAGTRIEGDTLIADRAGRPVLNGEKVDVLVIYEVKGDVDYSVGNIQFSGDVIIGGDVQPGFIISARGSVTVRGIIDRATIEAGQDFVARGIVSDGRSLINVGGNMTIGYAHQANISVAGCLTVNREILGCTVSAGKVQTSPSGRIVGGEVTAREEVTAAVLGSLQEVPTFITVLRNPEHPDPVVRATRTVHAGTTITLGRAVLRIQDDLPASSFWELDGDITRLGAMASSPRTA